MRSIETQTRRDLAGYYAMIENLDWNYGRIVQTLTELGLVDKTHILFFAAHGDSHGSHGQFLKTNPYEESIKTSMILSGGTGRYDGWKNGYAPVVSNHVDIAPTTLGLCGIAKPDWCAGTTIVRVAYPSRLPATNPIPLIFRKLFPPAIPTASTPHTAAW